MYIQSSFHPLNLTQSNLLCFLVLRRHYTLIQVNSPALRTWLATFLFFFCQSLTSFSFQLSHHPFPLQIFLHLQLFIYPLPPPFMTHSLCIFTHVLLPLLFLLFILLFPLFFFCGSFHLSPPLLTVLVLHPPLFRPSS